MSNVVRSSQVILDNKKFVISSKVLPTGADVESAPAVQHENTAQMAESLIKKAVDEADQIIANAMDEAQQKIVDANQEAEKIIADAMDQAKELMEKSYQDGLESGRQEGFDEGRTIAEAIIQEAVQIKEDALSKYREILNGAEPTVVEIILETVTKILNKEMQDPDYIIGLVKSAIDKCTYTQQVVLRVAEEDYDFILIHKERIIVLCENVDDIDVKPDKSLPPGSCMVESISGSIDSSLHTQLAYIENRFRELLTSE